VEAAVVVVEGVVVARQPLCPFAPQEMSLSEAATELQCL
jgi:hypothetical protein